MAKAGNLTKIKTVLKKMQSFKLSRTNSIAARHISSGSGYDSFDSSAAVKDLHPVYVGKCRRRYLVSDEVIDNPLFRELVDRRSCGDGEEDTIAVSCEVVLFEHLLWMLENADPQPDSFCELAQFYAY